jgi:muramoyltetrapeptide carboxypeptidase
MTRAAGASLAGYRPAGPGSRVALVAPASPVDRSVVEAGAAELRRLGFEPVWDESVFAREGFVAGSVELRARALNHALTRPDVDAVVAVRGGYGSIEILPRLDIDRIAERRTAFVGYSDVTSVHLFLAGLAGMRSVHGPMIDRRLATGPAAYDPVSFVASLGTAPMGELRSATVDVIRSGEAEGPLFGGTLTQMLASFETPFSITFPPGHVLFIDEVGERPYRLRRMLAQWQLSGRLAHAAAIVFGQLPGCDEPSGTPTAASVIAEVLADFNGPVLTGFPSGHTTTPLVTLPLGVRVRVHAGSDPRLVFDEPAAGA